MAVSLPGGMPDDIPGSMLRLIELPPPEYFLLRILKDAFPDVYITPRLPPSSLDGTLQPPHDPMVLVRKDSAYGGGGSDPRFTGSALVNVHVFTTDPDGERKGALISEACRVAIRNASLGHWYYEGLGTILRIDMTNEPSRKTDWATATGPVQFADLPSGAWRFETTYRVHYRKDTKEIA